MSTDRKDFYGKHLVDNNKEADCLDTRLHTYAPTQFVYYDVPAWFVGRIDLISYVFYDTVEMWWLIAYANDIFTPYLEVTLGKTLKIPHISEYYKFYNINSLPDEVGDSGFNIREIT